MSTDKEKYLKILDALSDALGRSEGQSTEEIKTELREEGMDVDAAMARLQQAQQNIAMTAKRSVLDVAREKRLELVKKSNEFIGKYRDWPREKILARIQELSGPTAGLAYRNLETMGAEDINSVLEDLEMARYRQTLENDGHGE